MGTSDASRTKYPYEFLSLTFVWQTDSPDAREQNVRLRWHVYVAVEALEKIHIGHASGT